MALGSNYSERPRVKKQQKIKDAIARAGGYKDHKDAMEQIKKNTP